MGRLCYIEFCFIWNRTIYVFCCTHYGDVIMGAIASQITSLTIVYSTVYSDADQRKHQSSASLAFVRGIHRGPVNSPHKWPVTQKCFHLITSSCSFSRLGTRTGSTRYLAWQATQWLVSTIFVSGSSEGFLQKTTSRMLCINIIPTAMNGQS